MDFPQDLIDDLEALTQALDDPGTDLRAILAVLADDMVAAVPSFLGLTMTLQTDGGPVTMSTMEPAPAGTSMLLPLSLLTDLPPGSQVVFYAANPGAFVDLAADTRAAYQLDGQVVLDSHLPIKTLDPAGTRGTGPAEQSEINQAVGVLIEHGYSPTEARAEIATRAGEAGVTLSAAAGDLARRLIPMTEHEKAALGEVDESPGSRSTDEL